MNILDRGRKSFGQEKNNFKVNILIINQFYFLKQKEN